MRHGYAGKKLGRPTDHRSWLLVNLAISLIEHEQVTTTLSKAKTLRPFVEKLITIGKQGTLHGRRQALSKLKNNSEAVQKLFSALAERYKSRNGGYTRVIKTGFRLGDAAPTAIIEFVDRDEEAKGKKQKTPVQEVAE